MDEQQFLHDAGDNLKPPASAVDGVGSVSKLWFTFHFLSQASALVYRIET